MRFLKEGPVAVGAGALGDCGLEEDEPPGDNIECGFVVNVQAPRLLSNSVGYVPFVVVTLCTLLTSCDQFTTIFPVVEYVWNYFLIRRFLFQILCFRLFPYIPNISKYIYSEYYFRYPCSHHLDSHSITVWEESS